MDPFDGIQRMAEAEGARMRARHADLGYADVLHDRLVSQVVQFEASLSPEEEIGCMLASFGREVVLRISDIGFHNPYFIVFDGEDPSSGERYQLVQHVYQISVLFKAVSKSALHEEARRIGFNMQDRASGDE